MKLPSEREIAFTAVDESSGHDWDSLKYPPIYQEGFIDGAKWIKSLASKCTSEWVSVETAKELEQVLTACKTKLQVYRSHNNGIYQGGMEHTALIKLIENTYERICKPVLEPPKGDE